MRCGQGRLHGRSGREVRIRQAHQAQPRAHHARHRKELGERHEVMFVVPAHLLIEGEHRVEVARRGVVGRVALRAQHAQHQRRAMSVRLAVQVTDVGDEVVGDGGGRGLRPHDELRAERLLGERLIDAERRLAVTLEPLLVLRDRPLYHGHRHRCTAGLGPGVPMQRRPESPRNDEQQACQDPLAPPATGERHQRTRAHQQQGTDAVNAHHGGETGEPGVGLGVAERQPGEPRQEPAAPPLDEQPARGERHQPAQRTAARQPARHRVAERRVIQAHDEHQPQQQEQGEPRRCRAVDVDADVQPVGAGGEERAVEAEPQPRRLPGRGVLPQPHEHGRTQHCQRPQIQRRKRGRERRPGGHSQPRPQRRGRRPRQAVAGFRRRDGGVGRVAHGGAGAKRPRPAHPAAARRAAPPRAAHRCGADRRAARGTRSHRCSRFRRAAAAGRTAS